MRRNSGCADQAVFVLASLGVIGGIALAMATALGVDEVIFEGLIQPDYYSRLLSVAPIELGLLVPIGLLAILWKQSRYRLLYRTWSIGLVYSLVLSVARLPFITDMQLSRVIQLVGSLVLFGLLAGGSGWLTGSPVNWRQRGRIWSGVIAVVVSGVLAIPWVMYGALGSLVDTLITFLTGMAFGLFTAWLLWFSLLQPLLNQPAIRHQPYWLASVGGLLTLGILLLGLSYTGYEWYLYLAILFLAFPLASLTLFDAEAWLPAALMLGFGAASPLMFVDPDEMSIVISSGPGELIQWITRAGWLAALIALLSGAMIYRINHRLRVEPSGRWVGLSALVALVVLAIIYTFVGQPGFHGERLFVILKTQADVSSAIQMTDYNQRRSYVYQILVQTAEQTQANLEKNLSQYHIRYKPYYLVNGLEVWGGPFIRAWLQSQPEVDRILSNPELRPLPEPMPQARGDASAPTKVLWNQSMIGADKVWNELGVTGKNIVIGQSDTGVQADHPDLTGTYRGTQTGSDYNWFDPWYHSSSPNDITGHGTHTMGIVLGKYTGIAPGATWFGCVNLARNLGNPSFYLDCMQFMLAPFPLGGDPFKDGDPTRSANVMNDSWGCPKVEGCDPNSLRPAVQALRAAGIFVVASAGNNGYAGCSSVTDPLAIYGSVYSVGAIAENGNLADFSSLGPVQVDGSDRIKPDIVAPGQQVLSAFPESTYAVESGTSMAGPHVVGVVALMWSANPKLIGDIDRTTRILDQTTQTFKGQYPACVKAANQPNNAVGWGVVDAYSAVKMAMQVQ